MLMIAQASRQGHPVPATGCHCPIRLLATAPLVALGYGYSWYLWHWPLLIFWLSPAPGPARQLCRRRGSLLVSGLLAYLTTPACRAHYAIGHPPA